MATNSGKKTKAVKEAKKDPVKEAKKDSVNEAKKDPVTRAHDEAEKDILEDPELSDPDPTDDLDEGELARKDNSDEEAFDQMQK